MYDTPKTKAVVKKVIDWYKTYRDILNSDIIHLKRPSGKDWDGFMHVNPKLKEKGLMTVFNPTGTDMVRNIELPLYYTGIKHKTIVKDMNGVTKIYKLTRDYKIHIPVTIPANSYYWMVII